MIISTASIADGCSQMPVFRGIVLVLIIDNIITEYFALICGVFCYFATKRITMMEHLSYSAAFGFFACHIVKSLRSCSPLHFLIDLQSDIANNLKISASEISRTHLVPLVAAILRRRHYTLKCNLEFWCKPRAEGACSLCRGAAQNLSLKSGKKIIYQ